MRRGRRPDERGSATVWLLAGILAAGVLWSAWVRAGLAGVARQRAETAADLAALAAARLLAIGSQAGCEAASDVARRNGAQLLGCVAAAGAVTVQVMVSSPLQASSSARAGLAAAP